MGNKCYYNGNVMEIVGQFDKKHHIAVVLESYVGSEIGKVEPVTYAFCADNQVVLNDTAYVIPKDQCEDLCTDCFELGTVVKSTVGSFEGTITGYEVSTNRLVCVSKRINGYKDDRTRYAYKPYEIKAYDPTAFIIKLGNWYKINGKFSVFAADDPIGSGKVQLIMTDGIIFRSGIDTETTRPKLALEGISNIQQTTYRD